MNRDQKAAQVEWAKGVFQDNSVVVVIRYTGLSVAEMTDLRARMREAGAGLKVAKNRLVKIAAKDGPADRISDLFTGPTALGFSQDPIAAPKAIAKFAKENKKLVILGGIMGETALDEAGVKALASLPSLDELRGKLVGLIQAPAQKIASVLQAPGGQVARVINAYAAKDAA
ncbi:MAG: 50S ribosomal protein L10 [Parvularculaceae bacterium]